MSIPKEPRQQMINLMYLVLTALLALNVSAEVLNAFRLVSDGMSISNKAIDNKTSNLMAAFQKQIEIDPNNDKTQALYSDAQTVTNKVGEFVVYVDSLKQVLIDASGGYKEPGDTTSAYKGKKNYDVTTRLMIDQGQATRLKNRINDLKAELMALPEVSKDSAFLKNQITLSTDYNEKAAKKLGKKDWEHYTFHHVPVVAVSAILEKIKSDAKNTETLIIETLLKKIGATDYKFDQLKAQVFANSSYVLQGETYRNEIFLSAFNSTLQPEVFLGSLKTGVATDGKVEDWPLKQSQADAQKVEVKNGIAQFEKQTTGVGPKNYEGTIKIPRPNSKEFDYYPFKFEYTVATPGLTISPTKMNVFYIGLDNPVSISVSGVPDEKVSASITQGSIRKGGESGWIVTVKDPNKPAIVNVSAQIEGGNKQMGQMEFRVKRVPKPVAKVAGKAGGSIKANEFRVQRGVIAELEDFLFDLKFEITGFEMTYAEKRQDLLMDDSNGPLFTEKMKGWMQKAKPGDIFYLDNIKAKGPDGMKNLNSISFKII